MFKEIKKLYDAMYDEKSKRYFVNRLCGNITGNGKYFLDMIKDDCTNVDGYSISDYYEDEKTAEEKKLIVYGAFNSGQVRFFFNRSMGRDDILCFCDRNPDLWKTGFLGKKVISPEELVTEYKDCYVLIETKYFYQEVYDFMVSSGFNKENIILHSKCGTQYFDYEYFDFSDDEVMIDGGCFDCETVKEFIHHVGGNYSKVIAFEPDKLNYEQCKNIIKNDNLQRIKMVNAGLWNENTKLSFQSEEKDTSCSRIVEGEAGNEIEVVKIDDTCKDEKVSFIKMDIEGSELNALHGARDTITKNKPKLAICIYHKPEDIVEIQEYLINLVPEYKFGIRHYADHAFETVLYAFV